MEDLKRGRETSHGAGRAWQVRGGCCAAVGACAPSQKAALAPQGWGGAIKPNAREHARLSDIVNLLLALEERGVALRAHEERHRGAEEVNGEALAELLLPSLDELTRPGVDGSDPYRLC